MGTAKSVTLTVSFVHHLQKHLFIAFWSFCLELVLKVRIQNPNARENDFIEVELDRQELTYRSLLRVCCRELDISAEHVEKIRKLPNTMLRKVQKRRLYSVLKFFVIILCHVHTRVLSVYCVLQEFTHIMHALHYWSFTLFQVGPLVYNFILSLRGKDLCEVKGNNGISKTLGAQLPQFVLKILLLLWVARLLIYLFSL